jgi:hypothetical protein
VNGSTTVKSTDEVSGTLPAPVTTSTTGTGSGGGGGIDGFVLIVLALLVLKSLNTSLLPMRRLLAAIVSTAALSLAGCGGGAAKPNEAITSARSSAASPSKLTEHAPFSMYMVHLYEIRTPIALRPLRALLKLSSGHKDFPAAPCICSPFSDPKVKIPKRIH